ncbi:MAG: hypothetical protein ACXW08_10940, partial [Solirubrobacteraceae bacterium]
GPNEGSPATPTSISTPGGAIVEVRRRCEVLAEGPPPRLGRDRIVAAVGRWNRLKDPVGIPRAFAEHVAHDRARLVLAGPPPAAVSDDPGGRRVLEAVRSAWSGLPSDQRRRISVVTLPSADVEENALIVNALQPGRGRGQDQIEHRRTGLLDDPGDALEEALAGRETVRRRFLADSHFRHWVTTLRAVLATAA